MQRTIRSVVLALALPVLAAGAVHARPLVVHHPAPTGILETLWQWVAPYLSHWSKVGGEMDPDGARPTSDSGGMMDPDGARLNLPTPLPTSDAGSDMDPDG